MGFGFFVFVVSVLCVLVSRVQLITVGFPPRDVLIIPKLDNYLCPQEQLTHSIAARQRRLGEPIKSFNIFYVGYKRSFVTNISMKCQIPSFLALQMTLTSNLV